MKKRFIFLSVLTVLLTVIVLGCSDGTSSSNSSSGTTGSNSSSDATGSNSSSDATGSNSSSDATGSNSSSGTTGSNSSSGTTGSNSSSDATSSTSSNFVGTWRCGDRKLIIYADGKGEGLNSGGAIQGNLNGNKLTTNIGIYTKD